MRVLHIYKTFYPYTFGGVEQVIHQLAMGTAAQGVENTVFSLHPGRAAVAPARVATPYMTHSLPRLGQLAAMDFSFGAFGAVNRLVRKTDLIHYHFPWPFMDLLHFGQRLSRQLRGQRRVPTLVTYHSDIVRQRRLLGLYVPLRDRFLGDVDRIVATSPAYLASSPALQKFTAKVSVIPIGIEDPTTRPVPAADVATLQARLAGLGSAGFLLFVGALRAYKGLSVLLDALRGIDLPLVIAGDGPERVALEAQARRLGLQRTLFLGAVSEREKQALYKTCTAFVFPSILRSEAFGVSLLEAASYGKPLLATELGTGTSYINQDGETGLVVPPNDPVALRAAVRALWHDPARLKIYGAAARERYLRLFRAEIMAAAYMDEYRRLIACRA